MPIPLTPSTGISRAYDAVRQDQKGSADHVVLGGQALLQGTKGQRRGATEQDRTNLIDALTRLVSNEIMQAERWASAGGESQLREAVGNLAAQAVQHVCQPGRAITLSDMSALNNIAQHVAQDAKDDFVTAAQKGDVEAASNLFRKRLNTGLYQRKHSPVPAAPAREGCCSKVTALLYKAGQAGGYLANMLLRAPTAPWRAIKKSKAPITTFTAFTTLVCKEKVKNWETKEPGFVPQRFRNEKTEDKVALVSKTLGDLLGGNVALPDLLALAAAQRAFRTDPACAAAAVDEVYEAVERAPDREHAWTAAAFVLLDVHPEALKHVYLSEEQVDRLWTGSKLALDATDAVAKNDSYFAALIRPVGQPAFMKDSKTPGTPQFDRMMKWGRALNTLQINSRKFEEFMSSDMAQSPHFSGRPLDELIDFYDATSHITDVDFLIEIDKALDDKAGLAALLARVPDSDQAGSGGLLEQADPGAQQQPARIRPEAKKSRRIPPASSKRSLVPSAGAAPHAPAGPGAEQGVVAAHAPTGRVKRHTSHHDIGKLKRLKKAERDLAGRPGKTHNHMLAVNQRRERGSGRARVTSRLPL